MRFAIFSVLCLFALSGAGTDFSAWKDSLRVYFNTTSSGAGLTAPLKNFPLLIRLDSSNFKLQSAAPGGADLRFADPDGTELPCHIERWDTGFSRSAEVWVTVPQVDAGSAADYVILYWGNPDAAMTGAVKARQAGSDVVLGGDNPVGSKVVFDTAFGFSGVWHLDEDVAGIGSKDAYRDATRAGNHGDDSASDPSGSGVVGRAQQFDAGTDYIVVANAPNLQVQSTMSFSAWIKPSRFSGIGAGSVANQVNPIVRKGSVNPNPYQFCVAGGHLLLSLDSNDVGGVQSPLALETGKWIHVGATWDGKSVQLYVNGEQVIDKAPPRTSNLKNDARPMYIGGRPISADDEASLDLFDGIIDEVQVSRAARGKEWYKLAYENQRPGSRLLEFVAPDTVAVVPTPETADTVLSPGQSVIRHGRIKVGNASDASASVRVRFLPAVDQSARGIADAGEIISLRPGRTGGDMPPVSMEINSGLSGNVSLFLILAGKEGTGVVRTFGGVGSRLLSESGEYFLGRDTVAPTLKFVAEGVTGDDSSWIQVKPMDNVENLVLSIAGSGPIGNSGMVETRTVPAEAGGIARLAFKGRDGMEISKVTLQVRDGTLEGWFPAPEAAYPLVRRLVRAKAPIGMAGDLAWKFAGIPLTLKKPLRFSELSGGGRGKEMFGAVWVNAGSDWNGTSRPGEYRILKDDDTLPTATGLWLAGRSRLDSLALGDAVTNTPGGAGSFSIRLSKGWNQVSSPVLENLAWPVGSRDTLGRDLSRVKALQGINPETGGYMDVDSLEPWRGFFVYSALDTLVALRAQAGAPGKRAAPDGAAASAGGGGSAAMAPIQIVLEPVTSVHATLGAIGTLSPLRLGAALYAKDKVGDEDEPMAPAAGDRSSLAAVRSGKGLKSDLLGFRPDAEFAWKLAWSGRGAGPSGVTRLRIASLRLPPGMVLWSISPLRKLAQPVALGAELDVQVDPADTLIFWAAPVGRSFGGRLHGYGAAPAARSAEWISGPGGGALRLALPEATGVTAVCRDASGRTLATLRRAGLAPGYHEFAWDGAWDRGSSGTRVHGLLIVTISFTHGAGPARISFKSLGR